jgi:hypothetical protein
VATRGAAVAAAVATGKTRAPGVRRGAVEQLTSTSATRAAPRFRFMPVRRAAPRDRDERQARVFFET